MNDDIPRYKDGPGVVVMLSAKRRLSRNDFALDVIPPNPTPTATMLTIEVSTIVFFPINAARARDSAAFAYSRCATTSAANTIERIDNPAHASADVTAP